MQTIMSHQVVENRPHPRFCSSILFAFYFVENDASLFSVPGIFLRETASCSETASLYSHVLADSAGVHVARAAGVLLQHSWNHFSSRDPCRSPCH